MINAYGKPASWRIGSAMAVQHAVHLEVKTFATEQLEPAMLTMAPRGAVPLKVLVFTQGQNN